MKKTPLTLKKFQESVLLFLLVVLHVGKNILKVYQNMVTTKGPNVTSKNMAAKAIKCECEEYKNSSLVIFIVSVPVSSSYSDAMQGFTQKSFVTSEQHKGATTSRMRRDREDLEKITDKLKTFSPFSDEVCLHNIITGVNANEDVNVHNLFTIGSEIVATMEGQSLFSFSYKRSMKAKTLASTVAVDVAKDNTIDPALLFQRFLVVSQTADLSLDEVMAYELSPYPPSLFEAKHLLRKPDKAQLMDAMKKQVTESSDDAVLKDVPEVEHNVLDGGSLLHRLKWSQGKTYCSIADDYASFTVKHYGKATIVFDGYIGGPNTKDITHQRRRQNRTSNKVNIAEGTKFVGKKEDFLSNVENSLLSISFHNA